MNSFMNNLNRATNYSITENGALSHKTTMSAVLDLFAFGGAYRSRSESDCIVLFKAAFEEDPVLALKCLFYLRDIRGGQGERRFFRTCFRWLADNRTNVAIRNLENVSEYGRWDDLIYACESTAVELKAFGVIKHQLALDVQCKTPSLLAKWMPSENASSKETARVANKLRNYLGMSHKEYRKTLSVLRSRINIVEKLMSENRWDEIEFDKLPSKAGLIYKNAFARRDILAKKYETFAKDKNTKVNAAALYPYEIVAKVTKGHYWGDIDLRKLSDTDRAMLEKYWENQIDVLQGKPCKMLCVCDTSGSMTGNEASAPINIAIGLAMYCAERIGGPFKDHYISFSSRPQLIKIQGVDFADKVKRIYDTNLCDNTDLVKTFDLILNTALKSKKEDIPETIVVISDMEIDSMSTGMHRWTRSNTATEMELVQKKWAAAGLKCPKLVYWNVQARNNQVLDLSENVSFVSGASPVIFKQVATGKTGYDLMLDTINSERYANVK